MKIIKVKYKGASDEAIFCDLTYKPLFRKERTREVLLRKFGDSFSSFPRFSDTGNNIFHDVVNILMLREYQKQSDPKETDEEKDKRYMYFITSHTDFGLSSPSFCWPILPDPAMGEEFCQRIKKEHAEIAKWMQENPEKVKLAELGCYKQRK